ncbi:MAG TPA: hypothetical protein VFQ44_05940 [Streptosporangiaceae bacterium]|nr:hypothetical protein [Streptosporangiaceae bacterium]
MHRVLFRSTVFAAPAAVMIACVLGAGPAAAARPTARPAAPQPGHWTQVTTAGQENFADVGLARGANGVLHVLWTSGQIGNMSVWETPVQPNGVVGKPDAISKRLVLASFPDATLSGRTMHAFWNQTPKSGTPSQTAMISWPAGARHWSAPAVVPATNDSVDFTISAGTGADGQPWVAFVDNGNQGFEAAHYGHARKQYKTAGCCAYNAGIGVDSRTSTAWVTWYSNATHKVGILAQQLKQDGTRVGNPIQLPGSSTGGEALAVNHRTTATGLGHHLGGVYVTYLSGWPTARKVDLMRLGAKSAVAVSTMTGSMGSTLAADPWGRLWVAWWKGNSIFLRRAASGAGKFGKTVRLAAPAGTGTLWKIYINAQAKRVDVLALLTVHNKLAWWHTQVLPPK